MVPLRVAKIKTAGRFNSTWKPVPLLAVMPVAVAGLVGGMATTRGRGWPWPLKSSDRPLAVVLTHQGLVGVWVVPQAPARLVSVTAATPETSDTKLLCA